MEIRVIPLLFGPEINARPAGTLDAIRVDTAKSRWEATWGQMRLQEQGVFDCLESVLTQCRMTEWAKAAASLAAAPAFSNPTKHVAEFVSLIQRSEPEKVFSLTDSQIAELKTKLPAGYIENLKSAATTIVNTPTVFALPQFVQDSAQGNRDTLLRFISDLTAGVRIALLREQNRLKIGFAFFEARQPEGVDLKSTFLSSLITGVSGVLQKHATLIDRPGPVLFEGRTGSGKSHAAHAYAQSRGKTFIKVNVSSVQEEFVEARLRGYAKGYHSQAEKESPGWLELGRGGVLLLDEFQSAPSHVQTQLLDIVDATSDRARVSRLGDEGHERIVDLKIILAVNRPILEMLESGEFREDLYFRMRNVVHFPELNELLSQKAESSESHMGPRQYVSALLRIFRWKFAAPLKSDAKNLGSCNLFPSYDEEALRLLIDHDWQGNFRQFESVVADLFYNLDTSSGSLRVTAEDVSAAFAGRPPQVARRSSTQYDEAAVVDLIEKALKENKFVITKACKQLAHLKIKDVATLRKRIVQHFSLFSPLVQNNPKIVEIFEKHKGVK